MNKKRAIIFCLACTLTAATVASIVTYAVTSYKLSQPQRWKNIAIEWLEDTIESTPNGEDYFDLSEYTCVLQSHDTLRRLQDYVRRGDTFDYTGVDFATSRDHYIINGQGFISDSGMYISGISGKQVNIAFSCKDSYDFATYLFWLQKYCKR